MGTLTGFMQPYIPKNGNPLCILILFYGDRIQHRREPALHFFGNLIVQHSSPMCIIEPWPLMTLSVGHHCSFLGPFLSYRNAIFFLFTEGKNMIEHLRQFPVRVRTVNLMSMSVRKNGPQNEA